MRVLKKYPNRRIYDTEKSEFITQSDIRTLIKQYVSFKVVDSKTGADLTRNTLMQLINDLDQEESQGLLTNKVLEELIRFYDNPMSTLLASYIEKSIKMFMSQEESMRKQFSYMPKMDMEEMYKTYSDMWQAPAYGKKNNKEGDS
ncbi:MAG: polyhydroxyalkanoate synthesis repressor PhaR [Endozoicomonas sp.]